MHRRVKTVLIVVAIAAIIPVYSYTRVQMGFGAEGVLKKLGTPESTTEISDLDRWSLDGTQPEMAAYTIKTTKGADEVTSYFKQACERIGFIQSNTDDRRSEPQMICRSKRGASRKSVHLTVNCDGVLCKSYVQVLHY